MKHLWPILACIALATACADDGDDVNTSSDQQFVCDSSPPLYSECGPGGTVTNYCADGSTEEWTCRPGEYCREGRCEEELLET